MTINVNDMPIVFSATDPISSDAIFGDDKEDELRKHLEEEDGNILKNAFIVEAIDLPWHWVGKKAREIEDEFELPEWVSRDARKFIARSRVARDNNMTPGEFMAHYRGKALIDADRLEQLGYGEDAAYIREGSSEVEKKRVPGDEEVFNKPTLDELDEFIREWKPVKDEMEEVNKRLGIVEKGERGRIGQAAKDLGVAEREVDGILYKIQQIPNPTAPSAKALLDQAVDIIDGPTIAKLRDLAQKLTKHSEYTKISNPKPKSADIGGDMGEDFYVSFEEEVYSDLTELMGYIQNVKGLLSQVLDASAQKVSSWDNLSWVDEDFLSGKVSKVRTAKYSDDPKDYISVELDFEEMALCQDWHSGQWDPLYALQSSGLIAPEDIDTAISNLESVTDNTKDDNELMAAETLMEKLEQAKKDPLYVKMQGDIETEIEDTRSFNRDCDGKGSKESKLKKKAEEDLIGAGSDNRLESPETIKVIRANDGCCEICLSKNGMNPDEEGYPPFHGNCRCITD
jgi:hypothetical protein